MIVGSVRGFEASSDSTAPGWGRFGNARIGIDLSDVHPALVGSIAVLCVEFVWLHVGETSRFSVRLHASARSVPVAHAAVINTPVVATVGRTTDAVVSVSWVLHGVQNTRSF